MAAKYFGLNVGAAASTEISGSSTTSKDVEIVINDVSKVLSIEDLMLILEKFEIAIPQNGKNW